MIKIVVFDVDGTLTDGKIYMGVNGEMMKAFDIKDGCALHDIMPQCGITPVIVTARTSQIVKNRCDELGITYIYQGVRDKVSALREAAAKLGETADENGIYQNIAYMGDDLIDIPVMKKCGIKACPKDAAKQVAEICDFVSDKNGGDGAVREFTEWLTQRQRAL